MPFIFQTDRGQADYSCGVSVGATLYGDSHDCLLTYANTECQALHQNASIPAEFRFCDLCDTAKETSLHCTPLPRHETVSRYLNLDKTMIYPLSQGCSNGDLTTLCNNFHISTPSSQQAESLSSWIAKLGVRYFNASYLDRLFYMDKAMEEHSCTIFNISNQLRFDHHSSVCLYDYATSACQALQNNATDPAYPGFIPLCDVAKNPGLHVNPLPTTITHVDRNISLTTLCDSDSEVAPSGNHSLCDSYCLDPETPGDIPPSRCENASSAITGVFNLHTANDEYNCSARWDQVAWVTGNNTDCLVDYLDQECLELADSGNTTALLCNVCDASRNATFRCNPIATSDTATGATTATAAIATAAIAGISYLGYQWYQGYREDGLSLSMLFRPFLPSPRSRSDKRAANDGHPSTGYLPFTRIRLVEPAAADQPAGCLPLPRIRPVEPRAVRV